MLFIDIGNSMIKMIGLINLKPFSFQKHYRSDGEKGELLHLLKSFDAQPTFITSVNREGLQLVTAALGQTAIRCLNRDVMSEYAETQGFSIPNIDILGGDLFCDIVAIDKGIDTLIVDCGTVTKLMVVKATNEFLGGVLFPGMGSFVSMIDASTDLELATTSFRIPSAMFSFETEEAINIGVGFGTASLVSEYHRRLVTEYGTMKLIVTGGLSKALNDSFEKFRFSLDYTLRPYLTLQGLSRIYRVEGEFLQLINNL